MARIFGSSRELRHPFRCVKRQPGRTGQHTLRPTSAEHDRAPTPRVPRCRGSLHVTADWWRWGESNEAKGI